MFGQNEEKNLSNISLKIQALLAIVLALLLTPLWFLISILQLLFFKNILFCQSRIGKKGQPFVIYKFQSLRVGREGESEHQRLTGWGKLLRKTSLDELPQLINIIRGEMNFVGPRPLLPEYLSRYTKRQNRRHEVKPGVTGWAQVKGRNALSWEEQLELDVWYVDHRSLGLDLKILVLTFLKWFKASSEETGMRKAFDGKN